MKTKKEYTLYHGDKFIVIGTLKEIAEYLGVNTKAVMKYHTPSYRKKHNNEDCYILITIDCDESEVN